MKKIIHLLKTLVSMSGFVPEHISVPRVLFMLLSLGVMVYCNNYQPNNSTGSIIYFTCSTILYIGFICIVLPIDGLRRKMIQKYGEEKAYLMYEGMLGVLFFHNGIGLGYICSANKGDLFSFLPHGVLLAIAAILFVTGFVIKIWATLVVGVDIYYWKDMFQGKKICEFVVSGPYKYFSNPMYGIGQMQAYAMAIYYGSMIGLLACIINQSLMFAFYFAFEKKHIERVYIKGEEDKVISVALSPS